MNSPFLHFLSSARTPIFFVGDSAQEGDFNPVSANSDQDQFSPNNIHTLSTGKFWELTKWSPKWKCLDLLSNSLNWYFKEMYEDQFGEFVCGYWVLKG